MSRHTRRLSVGLGVWLATAAVFSLGCGAGLAPTGTGSTPVPIELPANFLFPGELGISVNDVRAGTALSMRPQKSLAGDTATAKALSLVETAQIRLDQILGFLMEIAVTTSDTTTSASGLLSDGTAWYIDFSNYSWPPFSTQSLTDIDCQTACSGHTAAYPLCVRLYLNDRRVWIGRFTAQPSSTSRGAGCFRTVSTNTTATTLAALFDGTESFPISGVWEQQTDADRTLELFWATTTADTNAVTVTASHATVTQQTPTASASLGTHAVETTTPIVSVASLSSYLSNDTNFSTDITALWQRASDRIRTSLTVEDTTLTDTCLTFAGLTAATGCLGSSLPPLPGTALTSDIGITDDLAADVMNAAAPTVTATSPTAGATDVSIDTAITITFDTPIDPASVTTSTISVSGGVTGTLSSDGATVTFTPTGAFAYETTYSVTASHLLQSAEGVAMNADYNWSFTTTTAPAGDPADSSPAEEPATATFALDTTFGTNGIATGDTGLGMDVAVAAERQSSGAVVVCGATNNSTLSLLTRFTADGTFDTDFTITADLAVGAISEGCYDLVLQSDDRILLAIYNQDTFVVQRYTADGALDPTWSDDGTATVPIGTSLVYTTAIALTPDGNVLAAGSAAGGDFSYNQIVLTQLNNTGAVDTAFGTDGVTVTDAGAVAGTISLVVQPDGKILVGGWVDNVTRDFLLLRYTATGALDTTFGTNGRVVTDVGYDNQLTRLVVATDGKIWAAGSRYGAQATNPFVLARYNSDGSLDTTFSDDGYLTYGGSNTAVTGIVAQRSNGSFVAPVLVRDAVTQAYSSGIIGFSSDGSLNTTEFGTTGMATTSFGTALAGATDILVLPDGNLVWSGYNITTGNLTLLRFSQ
ncbi:MAG: Ig-like domain-containing protein [Deltaproteobacteria bacterium]|nr:Ig-like domain-containing protein [Deltaproteobacteria bacterium]